MAYDNVRHYLVGVTAAGDLSADQHKFMVYGPSGVALNSAAGGEVDGVLEDKPLAAGRSASVAISPSTVKVLSGAAFAQGSLIASDAAGKAVLATTGQFAAGRALEAAGAADELVTVQLMPFGDAP